MAPTSTEQLNTMYTTTWYLRRKEIEDQIFNSTPFFYFMDKKGRRSSQGGRAIEIPLQYAKNETVKGIKRGGTVSLQATDPLTVAKYEYKYITGHIIRYFVDQQQNRGEAELIKKVNSDIDNLQASLTDKLETDMFGDGTGDGGATVDGLGNLVPILPTTGTVGGLNRATYSWWRNNYKNMSGEAASVYLRKRMNTMFNDCGKQGEGISRFPDILVCAQDAYELYDEECLEISRIMIADKKMADLGFGDLAFKGRPMTWSPSAPSGYMYFLNTSVLEWVVDPIENFSLGEWIPIANQPRDTVAHAMMVGNLTVANMKRLGVIYNIAA